MSVTIPTVATIRDQIISDIEGKLGITVPLLLKAALRVIATALAGALALLYRLARWVYAQIFPQTADADALVLIGGRYGITRIPAVRAKLTATATGDNDTLIPAGTLWISGTSVVYSQEADVTISGGTATIIIEALTTGADGNLTNGFTVNATSPIAGMDPEATIASTITEGEDQEALEDLRTRMLQRMQSQPQGGAAPDYVKWTREVAGIVKAFAFNVSAGNVTVYPLQAITGADRIPSGAKITEVQNYVSASERRPLCATVTAAAMTELTADVTITGLSPNDATTKAAIVAALTAYFYAAYPRQYPDEPNPTDILSVATIWAAVAAAGATAATMSMSLGTNYTLAQDEIVKIGTVSWA
jgi:uncharacterized phage protein gp47/JayE